MDHRSGNPAKSTTTASSTNEADDDGSQRQTPYQIFRTATEKDEEGDNNVSCGLGLGTIREDASADDDIKEEISRDDDGEEEEEDGASDKENDPAYKLNTKPTPSKASNNNGDGGLGFLSPNSVEIRNNARKLLLRQPGASRRDTKKKDKSRRRSLPLLPLQPLPSLLNSNNNHSSRQNIKANAAKTSSDDIDMKGSLRKLRTDMDLKSMDDIKEELGADLEEIQKAAKHIADRASRAGGEAYEAMRVGARSVWSELWE